MSTAPSPESPPESPPESSSESSPLSVWIIEDDRHYSETIGDLLDQTPDLRCTERFESLEHVRAHLKAHPSLPAPSVILLDIGLPGMDGVAGTPYLKAALPDVPVVMLTFNDTADRILAALRAGASGYLLKDQPIDDLLQAIREAVRGGALLSAPVADAVLDHLTAERPAADYGLSPREHEILALLAEGSSQRAMADRLSLSTHTVDTHLRSIYRKLGVRSNLAAVAKAYRERLL